MASSELNRRARELLAKGEVVMVIGYRESGGGAVQPAFITSPEQADILLFDERCGQNLAAYLPALKNKGKLAVTAKGCDSRSIVNLIKEKQLERAGLHILGVGCSGVMEAGRRSDACTTCTHPNPVIFDEMVTKPAPGQTGPTTKQSDFEKLSADERWRTISSDVSRCIRCYACRQVCPNCYCPLCFVDATNPQWVGKTTDASDNMVFHLMRALHMAGRCVECGACARACPMGIDLMRLNRKAAQIAAERFKAEAGTEQDSSPALAAFDPNDSQEFII